ncbi:MAG: MBL fold metallo-hydrolase [Verrucomicrobiota bacterium]
MKIKLWGTRGSIPTPSTQFFRTAKYGGETTCVSILSGDHKVILDGGSGLRLLGLEMAKMPKPLHATFLFSHVHWDHIQGFPFFVPGFDSQNHFELYGPRLLSSPGYVGSILEKALRGQQEDLNFPVQLNDMPCSMQFHDITEGMEIKLSGGATELVLKSYPLNHPGGCFGYRIQEFVEGKPEGIFAFVTDTEHFEDLNPNVQALSQNADLVLHDAQFTKDEYEGTNGNYSHKGWGHSTWEMSVRECLASGARKLLLHHHDPLHDDDAIDKIESSAQEATKGTPLEVEAAKQFQEFEI